MIKIKFNNKENFEEVEFSRNEIIITLKGIREEEYVPIKTMSKNSREKIRLLEG